MCALIIIVHICHCLPLRRIRLHLSCHKFLQCCHTQWFDVISRAILICFPIRFIIVFGFGVIVVRIR